jgi:hypothetical protein
MYVLSLNGSAFKTFMGGGLYLAMTPDEEFGGKQLTLGQDESATDDEVRIHQGRWW